MILHSVVYQCLHSMLPTMTLASPDSASDSQASSKPWDGSLIVDTRETSRWAAGDTFDFLAIRLPCWHALRRVESIYCVDRFLHRRVLLGWELIWRMSLKWTTFLIGLVVFCRDVFVLWAQEHVRYYLLSLYPLQKLLDYLLLVDASGKCMQCLSWSLAVKKVFCDICLTFAALCNLLKSHH